MLICSCFAITEDDLRQAVRAASHSGCAVDCPAGSGCGSCRPMLEKLLREEQQEAREAKERRRSPSIEV